MENPWMFTLQCFYWCTVEPIMSDHLLKDHTSFKTSFRQTLSNIRGGSPIIPLSRDHPSFKTTFWLILGCSLVMSFIVLHKFTSTDQLFYFWNLKHTRITWSAYHSKEFSFQGHVLYLRHTDVQFAGTVNLENLVISPAVSYIKTSTKQIHDEPRKNGTAIFIIETFPCKDAKLNIF